MCCEIFNQCSNNQMRDVAFRRCPWRIRTPMSARWSPGPRLTRRSSPTGPCIYHTDTAGLRKRYSFTPL